MPTRPTSVRIDTEIYPQLEARAKQAGLSVSEFMRLTVYEKLGGSEAEEVRQEVENLRLELADMRDDLAKMTRVILIVAGSSKTFSKELAEEWVAKNLNGKGTD